MDSFRSIHMNNIAMNSEPRITTSNRYFLKPKASTELKLRGLNKLYYNMSVISSTNDPLEMAMLAKIKSTNWIQVLACAENRDD